MKNIVVIGGGFAGLWSAVGAARKLDELNVPESEVKITLIDQNDFHSIRVRNYEHDLDISVIPFSKVLDPIDVAHIKGVVVGLDLAQQTIEIDTTGGVQRVAYDKLVYALGSHVQRPPIAGLAEHSFDVDSQLGARRLEKHLKSLPTSTHRNEKYTALVVGAGLTGLEIACELPGRLAAIRAQANGAEPIRVIVADASSTIGSDMGAQARAVIDRSLQSLGVETRTSVAIASVDTAGVTLANGEKIPAATVIWCAGMHANDLGRSLPVEKDRLGRVAVDEFMRVKGLSNVYAAGDVAWAVLDGTHSSVMSCQHGRPMGRYAGHNVAADIMGKPLLPLRIDWYTTILDLGPSGAVYTMGWDRQVVATGDVAKQTKHTINSQRIYPPLTGNRKDILAAAAPEIQAPPEIKQKEHDSEAV